MYDQNQTPTAQPGSIFQAFIDAVTKPTVENYENLLRNPRVTPTNAYLWVALSAAVAGLIFAIIGSFTYKDTVEGFGSVLYVLLCTAPLAGVLSVIGVTISAAAASAIAKAFGGTGTYDQVISLYGVISPPMLFVNLIISSIPFVNALSFFVGIYQLFLYIQAIRAAHKIDGIKAAIAALALPLLILCCLAIVVALALSSILAIFATQTTGFVP